MVIFYKFWNWTLLRKEPDQGRQLLTIFPLSFDESLKRISQDEQMDTYVRYWDDERRLVKTNYVDVRFLMRPNTDNLHNELHAALSDIPKQKKLRLSMDEPNINWRVFDLLSSFRGEKME